jgi:hypothetical protein
MKLLQCTKCKKVVHENNTAQQTGDCKTGPRRGRQLRYHDWQEAGECEKADCQWCAMWRWIKEQPC